MYSLFKKNLTYSVIYFIFKLYFFNYIMLKTALSHSNSKILKLILMAYLLIIIYTSPVSKLIILFLYFTESPKIIINRYRFFFYLCGSFNI
jgi:hypothetical protein